MKVCPNCGSDDVVIVEEETIVYNKIQGENGKWVVADKNCELLEIDCYCNDCSWHGFSRQLKEEDMGVNLP